MLKQLRQKKVMKRILWALAILIIPAFVLWGAGGLRESRNYAGMLFGKRVTFDEYRDSFDAVKNQALMAYGSNFYKIQDRLNLEEQAWDYLIMLEEAKQNRIKVSDEEVIARIASFVFFKDKDGAFDQRAYETILNNTFRTSPRQFEEEIRQALMIEKLIQEVTRDVTQPTQTEIEEYIKGEAETKDKEGQKELEEQRRERIKGTLLMTKRLEAIRNWREGLYKRANLISNIKKEKEIQGEKEE